jgi:hypothetical protein
MCITKNTQDLQEEIKLILERCRKSPRFKYVTESYLADKLNMTASTLNYQLSVAKNFGAGLYADIKDILKKEGVIKEPSEALRQLNNSLLETQTSLFHNLELLTLSVRKVAKDGRFDEDERPLILKEIESIREEINAQLDKLSREVQS